MTRFYTGWRGYYLGLNAVSVQTEFDIGSGCQHPGLLGERRHIRYFWPEAHSDGHFRHPHDPLLRHLALVTITSHRTPC